MSGSGVGKKRAAEIGIPYRHAIRAVAIEGNDARRNCAKSVLFVREMIFTSSPTKHGLGRELMGRCFDDVDTTCVPIDCALIE